MSLDQQQLRSPAGVLRSVTSTFSGDAQTQTTGCRWRDSGCSVADWGWGRQPAAHLLSGKPHAKHVCVCVPEPGIQRESKPANSAGRGDKTTRSRGPGQRKPQQLAVPCVDPGAWQRTCSPSIPGVGRWQQAVDCAVISKAGTRAVTCVRFDEQFAGRKKPGRDDAGLNMHAACCSAHAAASSLSSQHSTGRRWLVSSRSN